ncbi:unnamed protein product [Arctogadus glacialis]
MKPQRFQVLAALPGSNQPSDLESRAAWRARRPGEPSGLESPAAWRAERPGEPSGLESQAAWRAKRPGWSIRESRGLCGRPASSPTGDLYKFPESQSGCTRGHIHHLD